MLFCFWSIPISLPTPSGLPWKAIRADSPPDDPPEVRFRFRGFTVLLESETPCTEAADYNSPA
jgi:hypothetical protein